MYTPTIGLEIHIELNTKSKIFCACRNDPDEVKPNVNVCPICLAHPGTLPVINQEAVQKVIKTGLALNCQIAQETFFERKNYFYPDLPKGYQISQYQAPLTKGGYLEIFTQEKPSEPKSKIPAFAKTKAGKQNPQSKKIRIERIHLEEDTGRLVHQASQKNSLVDFNRAGIPLMELVTEPDISSAEEARAFIKELQLVLRYLGVSSVNMEKGEMRVEVNISLAKLPDGHPEEGRRPTEGSPKLGTKVEIKNLNSVRAVEKAIEFEIKRQSEILKREGKVKQETRGWNDLKEITFSQREKEQAHDYRYFPEPDLPALKIDPRTITQIKKEIPELPAGKRKRFAKEYELSAQDMELYTSQQDLGEYFEKVVSELKEWVSSKKPKITADGEELQRLIRLASNYISTDLQALLKGGVFQEKQFPITPENFAEFLSMLYTGEISSKIAKTLLPEMFQTGKDPSQIMEEKGLKQITDTAEIDKAVKKAIKENEKAVKDYQKGKAGALQFLVGQIMKETKGKASPAAVQEALKKLL